MARQQESGIGKWLMIIGMFWATYLSIMAIQPAESAPIAPPPPQPIIQSVGKLSIECPFSNGKGGGLYGAKYQTDGQVSEHCEQFQAVLVLLELGKHDAALEVACTHPSIKRRLGKRCMDPTIVETPREICDAAIDHSEYGSNLSYMKCMKDLGI